jgi:predicted phage baseplate assembly protein
VTFLFTLPDRTGAELVRLGTTPETAEPEIDLFETAPPGWATGDRWEFKHSFVGINVSGPDSRDFTIEDGTWARVVGYQRLGGEVVHQDYLAGVGSTVRFGDGEFGRMPARGNAAAGQDKFFRVRYRLGNGTRGNVAADTVRFSDPNGGTDFSAFGFKVVRVWNPLPTSGGVDAETAAEVRRDAPEAFRAVTYRAVRPEDFDEAAQRLAWVQRAGTSFRWTGSWLTAFTAADPRERADLPPDQRRALAIHLDRFRQAGREVHVLEPRYANLELRIAFCVEASAYAAQVERAVAQALLGRGDRRDGFFAPDRFTFGTPLDRSELEVAIQRVPGVRAVKAIWIRRRDGFAERPFVEPYYQPGLDEVIRVEGDRGHPDRGSVTLEPEGGA